MATKILFQTALNELSKSAVDTLGEMRSDELGNLYRYVKNKGSTGLVQGGCCLRVITSVTADIVKYVISPDGAGASTASLTGVAGIPRTGIGASGSSTGDYGWIMVEGNTTAYVMQTSILTDSQIDCVAIGTTASQPATSQTFGFPRATWSGLVVTPATDVASPIITRGVVLLNAIATGPSTVATVAVKVMCK